MNTIIFNFLLNMDYYYIWKYTVKSNLIDFCQTFKEDTICSFVLGLLIFIPFVLYIVFGCLYIIFVVLPLNIYSYKKKKQNKIEVINYDNTNRTIDIVIAN